MKYILKFSRNISIVLLGASLCLFPGCEEFEDFTETVHGVNKSLVYINAGERMDLTNCLGSTEIMLTPVGVKSDDPIFSTSVKLAGSVSPKDIEVTLAYDASLVEAYNQENGTSYLTLPKGISPEIGLWVAATDETPESIDLSSTTLTIPGGSTVSDRKLAVRMRSADCTQLSDGCYLLPIRIVDIQGADLAGNKGLDRMYMLADVTVSSNVAYYASSMSGVEGSAISDKSGWNITLDTTGDYDEEELIKVIDGLTSTRFTSSGARPAVFTIDMGKVHSVTGIQIYGYYSSLTPTVFDLYTSENGAEYMKIGSFEARTMAQCYIMYLPIDARYVRLDVKEWIDDSIGLTELNIYAK